VLKVGLTGGVASGKSTVAGLLATRGAAVRDADAVVAELYRPGAPGVGAVRELFGTAVLAPGGGVDRRLLAGVVLTDAGARERLEAAVHPLVRAQLRVWLGESARRVPAPRVAVVEAALLVETGFYREFDRLVVVTAPDERRRTWAHAEGWSAEKIERVMAAQTADAVREAAADYVLRNDAGLADLALGVDRLWALLLEDASALDAGVVLVPRQALALP
jgi:dephospho-CoA kinase